jgi:hypothetical protein
MHLLGEITHPTRAIGEVAAVAVVAQDRVAQLGRRRVQDAAAGGRGLRAVAPEDAGQDVLGGRGVQAVDAGEAVWLNCSVGEVDVVLRSSTGQSDIQGLSGLGAGQDHVRRVDREALRRVDGGSVPEPDVLRDVGRGQHDAPTQPSPGPGDSEVAVPADVSDAPTIPVLDPVGVADHQAAVVVPGDDDVAGADVGGVGQLASRVGRPVAARRSARARSFSRATSSRVGATSRASRPS